MAKAALVVLADTDSREGLSAAAFGVRKEVEAAQVELLDEYEQHPSIRRLVADGYQVITF
jgi:hypothetical protein